MELMRIKTKAAVLLLMIVVFMLALLLWACQPNSKTDVNDAVPDSSSQAEPEAVSSPEPVAASSPEPELKTKPMYVMEIDKIKTDFVVMTHNFNSGAATQYRDKMNQEGGAVTDDDFLNNIYAPESQKLIATVQAFIDYNGILDEECQTVQDLLVLAATDTVKALSEMERGALTHDLTVLNAGLESKGAANDLFTEAFNALQILVDEVAAEWDYTEGKIITLENGLELPVGYNELTGDGIRAIIDWDLAYPSLSVGDIVKADGTPTKVLRIECTNPETGEDTEIQSTADYAWDTDEIFISIYFYLW